MLIIMAGLSGTGKTTLARLLARAIGAVHLRVDTIEATLRSLDREVGTAGYGIAFAIAKDNLAVGCTVIADSTNTLQETRALWREVAQHAGVPYRTIEIICSDKNEHKKRVDVRYAASRHAYIKQETSWHVPSWQDIQNTKVDPWNGTRITLDTAGHSVKESFDTLCTLLNITITPKSQPRHIPRL